MPLYGAPQGISAALGDAASLGRLAMLPDEAQLLHAQAGLAKMKFREEQNWAKALQEYSTQQQTPGAAGTPADPLDSMVKQSFDLANLAAKAGAPDKAMLFEKQGAALLTQKSALAKNAAMTAHYKALDIQDKANWVAQHAGEASTPQGWERLKSEYAAEFPDDANHPYQNVPWSKDLPNQLRDGAIKASDQARLQIEANKASIARQNAQDAKYVRHQRLELARQRAEREKAAAQLKAKGGKVSPPQTQDINEARRMITKDYPNLDDPDSAAYSVAAEARAITARNPGISSDEALVKAYLAAKERGEFVQGQPMKIGGFEIPGTKGKTKFEQPELKAAADQAALAKEWGVAYDPAYEYKVVDGKLMKRKK